MRFLACFEIAIWNCQAAAYRCADARGCYHALNVVHFHALQACGQRLPFFRCLQAGSHHRCDVCCCFFRLPCALIWIRTNLLTSRPRLVNTAQTGLNPWRRTWQRHLHLLVLTGNGTGRCLQPVSPHCRSVLLIQCRLDLVRLYPPLGLHHHRQLDHCFHHNFNYLGAQVAFLSFPTAVYHSHMHSATGRFCRLTLSVSSFHLTQSSFHLTRRLVCLRHSFGLISWKPTVPASVLILSAGPKTKKQRRRFLHARAH